MPALSMSLTVLRDYWKLFILPGWVVERSKASVNSVVILRVVLFQTKTLLASRTRWWQRPKRVVNTRGRNRLRRRKPREPQKVFKKHLGFRVHWKRKHPWLEIVRQQKVINLRWIATFCSWRYWSFFILWLTKALWHIWLSWQGNPGSTLGRADFFCT